MKRLRGYDYTNNVDNFILNQMFDDLEAEMAEGGHKHLLDELIDIRREFDGYHDRAIEHAEILNDIKDCMDYERNF